MPDTKGNNKTNKKHRNDNKNAKRLAQLAAYAKHKKVPKPPKKGVVYDPVTKRLDNMKKANPIASLVTACCSASCFTSSV